MGTADAKRGRQTYLYVLATVRALNALRRTALGKNLDDVGDLVKNLNLLGIVPALAAVILVPDLFFRQVTSKETQRPAYITSPLKFAITTGAILALLIWTVKIEINTRTWWITAHHEVEAKTVLAVGLILAAALSPVLLAGAAVMAYRYMPYLYVGIFVLFFFVGGHALYSILHHAWLEGFRVCCLYVLLLVICSWLPSQTVLRGAQYTLACRHSPLKWFTGALYLVPAMAMLLCIPLLLRSFGIPLGVQTDSLPANFLNMALYAVILRLSLTSYTGMVEASVTYPKKSLYSALLEAPMRKLDGLARLREKHLTEELSPSNLRLIANWSNQVREGVQACLEERNKWNFRLRRSDAMLAMAESEVQLALADVSSYQRQGLVSADQVLLDPLRALLLPKAILATEIAMLDREPSQANP